MDKHIGHSLFVFTFILLNKPFPDETENLNERRCKWWT